MPGCGGGGGGVTTQKNGRYAWSITPNRRRARHHRKCDDATAPWRGATKWDYAVSVYFKCVKSYIGYVECRLGAHQCPPTEMQLEIPIAIIFDLIWF